MIEWFGGNQAAFSMYEMLKELAHTWDDIVDGEPRTEYDINQAFAVALLHLPLNPFYRQIQDAILPMWEMVISAYETANQFEREKSPHGLEISHGITLCSRAYSRICYHSVRWLRKSKGIPALDVEGCRFRAI